MNLIKKYRVKVNKEKNEIGLRGDETTEFEVLLEEIINVSEDTLQKKEAENEKAMKKKANEQNQALEIRQMAMQTMAQTEKRSSDYQKALKQKHSKRSNIQKLWIF